MKKTIEAVFEGGVLRPLEPLDLEEQERVLVTVVSIKEPADFQSLLSRLAKRAKANRRLTGPTDVTRWIREDRDRGLQ